MDRTSPEIREVFESIPISTINVCQLCLIDRYPDLLLKALLHYGKEIVGFRGKPRKTGLQFQTIAIATPTGLIKVMIGHKGNGGGLFLKEVFAWEGKQRHAQVRGNEAHARVVLPELLLQSIVGQPLDQVFELPPHYYDAQGQCMALIQSVRTDGPMTHFQLTVPTTSNLLLEVEP